jgi:MerR family copper efflux transcriptional regulator
MRSMKISELAKNAGVGVSTVRFYEREGLLPKPETRVGSGYREYTSKDLDRLRLIVAAKRQRFPLALIKTCLAALEQEEPCQEIAGLVEGRIRDIDRELADLQNLRLHLAAQLRAWKLGTLPKAQCLCSILETDAQLPSGETKP